MTMMQAKAIALPLLVLGTVAIGVVGASLGLPQDATKDQAPPAKAKGSPAISKKAADTGKMSNPPSQPQFDDVPAGPALGGGEMAGYRKMMGGYGGAMGGLSQMMRRGMGASPAEGGEVGLDTGEASEFRNRLDVAQLAASLASSDKNPRNKALLERLEEPLSMSFPDDTPLDDVIKYIKATTAKTGQTPLPIYVDPKGLQEADKTMQSPVTLDLDGVPLKTTLRLLLKQLGLAYCVRDGVVIISSVQGVREELAEAARELLGSADEELNLQMMNQMGIFGRGPMGSPGGTMSGGHMR
jgi:hypothetical protein